MKIFQVQTGKSVDELTFGTAREVIRSHFGADYREMKKSKYSKNTMDAYSICHIFYTPENLLEAIEIFPESSIVVDGESLPMEYDAAIKFLQRKSIDVKIDETGVLSKSLGISLYAPDKRIESVLIALPQYFEDV